PDGRDAAIRAGRASIRNQAIGGIGAVPKVIEGGLLEVIEEVVIARKKMRQGPQGCGRQALLRSAVHCRRVIEVGLTIDDLAAEIAETGRGQQAGRTLQGKRAAGAGGRAVHAIACKVGLAVAVPVQNDAAIAGAIYQPSGGLDGERTVTGKEEEKQSSFHVRAVLTCQKHTTENDFDPQEY